LTNRQDVRDAIAPENLPIEAGDLVDGTARRPLSVQPGKKLREEAVFDLSTGKQARAWWRVVNEWRDWYAGYRRSHIEFISPEGETVRGKLQNSYQPEYGNRYYAKLKQLERAFKREFRQQTTVMLTLTASNENRKGEARCPADHMREIAEGWKTARKTLHRILDGAKWEYVRVWEPHKSGYGHMHVAVFLDGDASAAAFEPVMDSYVRNCPAAAKEAHRVDGEDAAVSVNSGVENLGSYISEYIGSYGKEPLNRPISEQMFYATCWATGTRRVDFSNGAQDLISDQRKHDEFTRETGINTGSEFGREAFGRWINRNYPGWQPEYGSGSSEASPIVDDRPFLDDPSSGDSGGGGGEWDMDRVCTVQGGSPSYAEPAPGGVEMQAIDGRLGVDRPPDLE
jgi:hypothetical protein